MLSGCYSTRYLATYKMNLNSVDKNGNKDTTFKNGLTYIDSILTITWVPGEESFKFSMQNTSDKNFQILWNEAAIVIDGTSQRIFHQGVKLIDAEREQPPTTVIHGTSVIDAVLPSDGVEYVISKYDAYGRLISEGHWKTKNIFPLTFSSEEDNAYLEVDKIKGKQVIISLPIKQGDKTTEYTFSMIVVDAALRKEEEYDPIKSRNSVLWITTGISLLTLLLLL
jgi:hypothetical protein